MLNSKLFSTSKSNLIVIFSFILLLCFYRFILPYGDEPDFLVRLNALLNQDLSYLNPYNMFQNLLNQYNWSTGENIYQKLIRIMITLTLVTPLLVLIIFNKVIFSIIWNFNKSISLKAWNISIRSLSLSLIFPSIIYYIGILAEEQYTLILSLLIFVFLRSNLMIALIVFLIGAVDFGNSIVAVTFVVLCHLNKFILSKFGVKSVILTCLGIISLSMVLGLSALQYLTNLPYIGEKSARIHNDYTYIYTDIADKYPVALRPIITFITGMFWLPDHNFLTFYLYPFYFYFLYQIIRYAFSYYITNIKLRTKFELNDFVFFISGLTIIISIPLILNGYSTAKYYVFIIPFIMHEAVKIYKFKSIFYVLIFSNILILGHLIIYLNITNLS